MFYILSFFRLLLKILSIFCWYDCNGLVQRRRLWNMAQESKPTYTHATSW